MKSTNEILSMLAGEILNRHDAIIAINKETYYYNEILGDVSFLLGGLLESLLKKNFSHWNKEKWIDDCLISNVVTQDNKLKIEGIMIWGIKKTTEQWTDPFSFEIESLKSETNFKAYIFSFCDLDKPEITYEVFRNRRDYWAKDNRKWKYVINSNEFLSDRH